MGSMSSSKIQQADNGKHVEKMGNMTAALKLNYHAITSKSCVALAVCWCCAAFLADESSITTIFQVAEAVRMNEPPKKVNLSKD